MFITLLVNRLFSRRNTELFEMRNYSGVSRYNLEEGEDDDLPMGIIMIRSRTTIPTHNMILHFISARHILCLTRLAPLLKPCADTARLSVLS
jgi:hypothetical protein